MNKLFSKTIILNIMFFGLILSHIGSYYINNRIVDVTTYKDSIFRVGLNHEGKFKGVGTSFIFKKTSTETLLLSNKHVCDAVSEKDILIEVIRDKRFIKPKEILSNPNWKYDLCIIKLDFVTESPAILLSNKDVKQFDKIQSMGYPLGEELTPTRGEALESKIARVPVPFVDGKCEGGKIQSILFMEVCLQDFYVTETTLTAVGGASGSPVINEKGYLIGVLNLSNQGNADRASFVPLSDVKDFISKNQK